MFRSLTACVCLWAAGMAVAQSSPEEITFLSCAVCHAGTGDADAIPAIRAHAYVDLLAELTAFAQTADGSTIMHRFIVALTPPEIEALARHISELEGETR